MPPERPTEDDPLRHLFTDEAEAQPPLSRREARRRAAAEQEERLADGDEPSPADIPRDASNDSVDTDDTPIEEPIAQSPSTGADDAGVRSDAATATRPTASPFDMLIAESTTVDRAARRRKNSPGEPKKKRSGKPLLWTTLSIVVIAAIVASGFYVWTTFEPQIRAVMGWQEPIDYEGSGSGEAYIVISEGDTGTDIAKTLADADVTMTSEAFYKLLLQQEPEPTFQPGTYLLKKQMSANSALDLLLDPKSRVERTALLPEGLTGESILERLSDATEIPLEAFRTAVEDPTKYGIPKSAPSIEGWLFPALYTFEPDATAESIIQRLVDRTIQSLDDAGVAEADRERVLTIASIVQREARKEDDFYKVSRVIQNRLDKGMLLQMDSTAQYGVNAGTDSVWSSKEALESDNPWNTYKREGLPVGPIASPGDLAIDAATHPADGPWLYFVTVNLSTGETVFSSTNEEHERAVKQLRTWCDENPDQGC